jgi:hypothetical protein
MRALLFYCGVLALACAACFSPDLGNEPFLCGDQGACPPSYHCDGDGVCRRAPAANPNADAAPGGADGPLGESDGSLGQADGPLGQADGPLGAADAPGSRPDGAASVDARVADAAPLPDGSVCRPSTFVSCQDLHTAVFCNGDGSGTIQTTCEADCDPGAMQCNHCPPATSTCDPGGNSIVTCSAAGVVTSTTPCPAGCGPGQSVCYVLKPVGLPDACKTAGTADAVFGASSQFDTTTCPTLVTPTSGPPVCVYKYRNVNLDSAAKVRWTGNYAPVIIATGEAHLAGRLIVASLAGLPGPGASVFHVADGSPAASGDGSGGGGHATTGGSGSAVASSGRVDPGGGVALDSSYDDVLAPGGNGGSTGGGGGGALGIIACGRLTIDQSALVNANGGGGPSGTSAGGLGGGAGGTIRIEAAEIVFSGSTVTLVANGGGGGGGGGLSVSTPMPGEDGHLDGTAAKGAPGAAGSGAGGAGGTSDGSSGALPGDGQPNSLPTSSAGGGGGAAGVIILNARPDRAVALPAGAVVSPPPKLGVVERQLP